MMLVIRTMISHDIQKMETSVSLRSAVLMTPKSKWPIENMIQSTILPSIGGKFFSMITWFTSPMFFKS